METAAAVEKQKPVFPPLLAKPFGFRTVSTGPAARNQKQQNRTLHLLQKPDIFTCYRQSLPCTFVNSMRSGTLNSTPVHALFSIYDMWPLSKAGRRGFDPRLPL